MAVGGHGEGDGGQRSSQEAQSQGESGGCGGWIMGVQERGVRKPSAFISEAAKGRRERGRVRSWEVVFSWEERHQ